MDFQLHDHIQENINGRIGIQPGEAELLYDTLQEGDFYLEVGCLWGGTAILAAHKARRVVTIDFMRGGFWYDVDPAVKRRPTAFAVLDNFAAFGVAHKISVVKTYSHPWPLPAHEQPDVFLIDGGHSFEDASNDWKTASFITKRAILVHDYHRGNAHRGVYQMVNEIAKEDPDWKMVNCVRTMALFERRA